MSETFTSSRLQEIFNAEYGDVFKSKLEISLDLIKRYLRIDSVEGLAILDLACGGIEIGANDGRFAFVDPIYYPPAFCIGLSNLGADVIGVDISEMNKQDQGLYTHVTLDLVGAVTGKTLAQALQNRKFHVVHSGMFTGLNPSPMLEDLFNINGMPMAAFEALVRQAVLEILVEGGVYIADESESVLKAVWKKENGKLVKLR